MAAPGKKDSAFHFMAVASFRTVRSTAFFVVLLLLLRLKGTLLLLRLSVGRRPDCLAFLNRFSIAFLAVADNAFSRLAREKGTTLVSSEKIKWSCPFFWEEGEGIYGWS